MSKHTFSFEGGNYLTTIGATFFVSHMYFSIVDKSHLNWKRVATASKRLSTMNRTRKYHKYWLQQVLFMNPKNLNKNTLGLSGNEVIKMANDILQKKDKQCF